MSEARKLLAEQNLKLGSTTEVEGSAESVGRHTTASVVQSIFLVILFDALFAMFFMELHV